TELPFRWTSPPSGVQADYPGPDHEPDLVQREFGSLAEYSRETGQDQNSVMLGYEIFQNVPMLDAQDVARLQELYEAAELDFSLVPGSTAVDRGLILPTVSDDFSGAAPDLGALEIGKPAPHYGPRP